MNTNIQFRPLSGRWPGEPLDDDVRQRSRFDSTFGATLDLLDGELFHANAKSAVVQTDHRQRDIRNDGMPRSSAPSPAFPGVILTWKSAGGGEYSLHGDLYDDWRDNLRAIAKTLEAQRSVTRWGCVRAAETYRGFKALPGPGVTSTVDTPEAAAAFVASHAPAHTAGAIMGDRSVYRRAYRLAAIELHPDRAGDDSGFRTLQTAKSTLDARHGGD